MRPIRQFLAVLLVLPALAAAQTELPADLPAFFDGIEQQLLAGQPQAADASLRPVYAALVEQRGLEDSATARAALLLANVMRNQGWVDIEEARRYLLQAQDVFAAPATRNDGQLSQALVLIGDAHTYLGQFGEAKPYQKRAIKILESLDEPERLAQSLGYYTWTLLQLQELEEAESSARRGLQIRAANGIEHTAGAAFHHWHLARIADIRGELESSRHSYRTALEILQDTMGPRTRFAAEILIPIGWIEFRLANFVEAEQNYQEALEILQGLGRAGEGGVSWAENNLAILYRAQGRLDRAVVLYRRSLDRKVKLYGPDHPNSLVTKMNLIDTLIGMEETDQVTRMCEDVIAAMEKLFEVHEDLALAHQYLGRAHRIQGRPDLAREELGKSMAMREKLSGEGTHTAANILLLQADMEIKQGNLDAARAYAREAVRRMEASSDVAENDRLLARRFLTLLPHHVEDLDASVTELENILQFQRDLAGGAYPQVGVTELLLARIQQGRGDLEVALDWAVKSTQTHRDLFVTMAPGLPEAFALNRKLNLEQPEGLLLTLLTEMPKASPEQVARTWESIASSRGLVMRTLLDRRRAAAEANSPHGEARALVAQNRRALAHAFMRLAQDPTDVSRVEAVDRARARRDEAENALAAKLGWADVRATDRPLSLPQLAEGRNPGTALLAYVRYRRFGPEQEDAILWRATKAYHYAAFLLPAGTDVPEFVPLGPAEPIEDAVASWHEEASRGEQLPGRSPRGARRSLVTSGQNVRELVFDPILDRLGEATDLVWIPAGALHRLSPAAMVQEDGSYWVERDVRFHRLASEYELTRPATPAAAGLLVMGDVTYGEPGVETPAAGQRSTPCLDRGEAPFAPLPNTAAELDAVELAWTGEPKTVLRGSQASEPAFYRTAPGSRVIHLATHAFFLSDECTEQWNLEGLADSPLVRSGLALAGANLEPTEDTDDGIVTAEEIATLNLSGTERVVLSACDTAAGVLRLGEGALGLARSFLVAGAEQVVVSLWPVSDKSTGEFMARFYRDGTTISETQRARLAALREAGASDHPSHWAGFVSLGRPTQTR